MIDAFRMHSGVCSQAVQQETVPLMDSPSRSLKLLIAHLERVDPKEERTSVKKLQDEAKMARVLEARARLRGSLMHGG